MKTFKQDSISLVSPLEVPSRNVSRIIEFCLAFLIAFLVITLVSFLSLRPALKALRAEAAAEWQGFLREVGERNQLLPGLAEAVRGFESGHGKLAAKLLEARAVSSRSSDPALIVASVRDIESCLVEIEKLLNAKPEIEQHAPFSGPWKKVVRITYRINVFRDAYNKSVRSYNRLINTFPQNLTAPLFGFFPLDAYGSVPTIAD